MDQEQNGVIVFRLNQMETTIKSISDKLDQILNHQQRYVTDVALVKQSNEQLEKRINVLEKKTDSLQIGLAEKIGPGAISGAVVAGIMLLIKFMVGV